MIEVKPVRIISLCRMFIAQIRCSDEASYGRDVLPSPRTTSVRAEVTLEPELQLSSEPSCSSSLLKFICVTPRLYPALHWGLGYLSRQVAGKKSRSPVPTGRGAGSEAGRASQLSSPLGTGQPSTQPLHVTQVLPLPPSLGSALA